MLCANLGINEKVKPVMFSLAEGQNNQTQEPYIALLMQEPILKGKVIIIVHHIVLLAVQTGNYLFYKYLV